MASNTNTTPTPTPTPTPAPAPAPAPAPVPAPTWSQVRSHCRTFLDLTVGDAVSAATDKTAAINLIASAITGAVLEFGFTGNNARIESAKSDLAPRKGAGQKLRASALTALEALSSGVKPRGLKTMALEDLHQWCLESASVADVAMQPVARVSAEVSAVVAETSPVAGEVSPSIVAEASPLDPLDPLDDIMARTHGLDIEALIELQARITSLIVTLSEVTLD